MSICVCPSKEVSQLVEALNLPKNCTGLTVTVSVGEPVKVTVDFIGTKDDVELLTSFVQGYVLDPENKYTETYVLKEKE